MWTYITYHPQHCPCKKVGEEMKLTDEQMIGWKEAYHDSLKKKSNKPGGVDPVGTWKPKGGKKPVYRWGDDKLDHYK